MQGTILLGKVAVRINQSAGSEDSKGMNATNTRCVTEMLPFLEENDRQHLIGSLDMQHSWISSID
jgi:hypothetical protein